MNFTAATAIASKLFKLDTSDRASDMSDATLYVVDGAYGLAIEQCEKTISAELTVFDENSQVIFVLNNVMDKFKPDWLKVSPDWRNDPNHSDFYNEFSFEEWLESIYISLQERNKKANSIGKK